MIISNSRKFIFVHIHKTAGTAITHGLEQELEWNDVILSGAGNGNAVPGWYRERYSLDMHSPAGSIKSMVGEDIWREYFTFAIVRNPYRRILSLYTWLEGLVKARGIKSIERFVFPNRGIWAWAGTKAYLDSDNFSDFIRHERLQTNAPATRSMSSSLYSEGELLVDFVGKLENLNRDFDFIARTIGLETPEVKQRNSSRSAINPNQYFKTQRDLDFIYDLYREDFELFSYSRSRVGELI